MKKKLVAIGLLGTTLDQARGAGRWGAWRPTVSLCRQTNLRVDRLELLHQNKFDSLARAVASDIISVAPETRVERHTVEFEDAWDFETVYGVLHDFAMNYPFDPDREEYLLHITTGTHVAQICLFLLAESRQIPARLVQTSPPPPEKKNEPGEARIIDLDLSRYDRIAQRFHRQQREGLQFLKAGIDTKNPAFNRMMEEIEHVAIHARDPILLSGPTGAGKSKLARRIFELKKQRRQVTGRFVELNCATLRGDAAMSAMFGHKRGAFTGATADRAGLLREADGGLLFLDEVGELGSDEQAMLLRAIEEKTFTPMGSDKEVKSEFQLICGTNRDLSERVRGGFFRDDLLARINLWAFRMPALRERREDIEPNVEFELTQVAARTGVQVRFNREAYARFVEFATSPSAAWAGNFRDLSAAITRMSTLSPAGRITSEVVDGEIARLRTAWSGGAASEEESALGLLLGEAGVAGMDLFDRLQLEAVIGVCRRCKNLSEAGRELFAASRQKKLTGGGAVVNDADRLRKYLARFGLSWERVAAG